MVFSLADFDDLHLPSDTRPTSPISPDSPRTQSISPSNPEPAEQSASQQDTSLPTPALDPALFTIPPQHRTTNPGLHGEDLTQLARHLVLQKSLSKNSADELMSFAKVLAPPNPPVFILIQTDLAAFGGTTCLDCSNSTFTEQLCSCCFLWGGITNATGKAALLSVGAN